MEIKKCTACQIHKDLSKFYKKSSTLTGYDTKCKECVKNRVPAPRKGMVVDYELTGNLIVCRACSLEKDSCYFSFNKQRNKFHAKCKKCTINKVPLQKKNIVSKICKTCNKKKPLDCFYNRRKSCKYCISIERKLYNKQYCLSNRDKINSYRKQRRRNNCLARLRESISSSIARSLKLDGAVKLQKTPEILGCSIEEFKLHIENQFLSWMSWNNYGNVCGSRLKYECSWDLDHIIPISFAQSEEELIRLNHWSNFQPLCSKVNRDVKRNNIFSVTNLELNLTIIG